MKLSMHLTTEEAKKIAAVVAPMLAERLPIVPEGEAWYLLVPLDWDWSLSRLTQPKSTART